MGSFLRNKALQLSVGMNISIRGAHPNEETMF